jgi:SAM-dependent methyltransferase
MSERAVNDRTIHDFGAQWTRYPDPDGYLASLELLADNLAPFVALKDLKDRRVADIGSGTGRVVNLLLDAGARHVVALEPSAAFDVLTRSTAARKGQVTYLHLRADELPPLGDLDYVVSLGVLHHLPDPVPAVQACRRALRPGGRILVWLYGREGNRGYLAIAVPLRALSTRLPDSLLAILARILDPFLVAYAWLARYLPLPGRDYMRNVVARLSPRARRLTIFDQLNPAYAKYYTKDEARQLLVDGGFEDIHLHHRHGYSWLVVGRAPDKQPAINRR